MKNSNIKIDLKDKIAYLENKQANEFLDLKNQYYSTLESLKPLNLIKSATQEFILSPNIKSTIINTAIGFGTSYLSKNLLNENSANPIKRNLGKVLKFVLKNFGGKISKNI